MGGFWVTQLTVVLALLPGHLFTKIGKSCPCQKSSVYPMVDDSSHTNTERTILCCKDMLLGYKDPGASIQWSFNGEAFSERWPSSFTPGYCDETLTTTSAKLSDSGIYGCTITASNGTVKTFKMSLSVERNINHRTKPESIKGSPSTVAQLEDRITLTCESYVGTNDTNRYGVLMKWRKYLPNNNTHTFVESLPNVTRIRINNSSK
ncbi:hypothetical protein E2C01_034867 [Portunus trituberculatus]|nr:hypothetical protein [Portunus trituberculatus]